MIRSMTLLLAALASLTGCATNREDKIEDARIPESALEREVTVALEVENMLGGGSSVAGQLICYLDLDGVESPKELARRLSGSQLRLVGLDGHATIPAESSLVYFVSDECWPTERANSPTAADANRSVLSLVQQVRFADLTLVDEKGRTLEGIAWPMTDGEFPREIPSGLGQEQGGLVTEADGRIRLSLPWWPDRGIWVQVQAPGRAPRLVELGTSAPGESRDLPLQRIELERRLEALTFAVDDRTGRIVKPDLVRFRPASPAGGDPLPEGHQILDVREDGRFTLPIGSRRPFRLEVRAEGFQDWIDEAARIETLEIRLKPRR